MYLKGFKVTLAKHLGFRNTKEGDLDLEGRQMRKHETAFVYLKDCRIYEKDGKKYYDVSEVPAIPTANAGSYYGYGKAQKSTKPRRFEGKLYYEYWTRPVYFAHDGRVYTGTCYLFDTPSDWPLVTDVGTTRNIINILQEVLPYLKENQSLQTIVGRVQHAEAIIKHLQEKLEELKPVMYEEQENELSTK